MASQSKCLIPGLSDDVAVICIAKIPLLYRHLISGVCRRWRNLLHENYFWVVRREHSACQMLLLIWSKNYYKTGAWYGFYLATNGWIRLPLMPRDDRETGTSTFAAVDEKLFVIGGSTRSRGRRRLAAASPAASQKVTYFDLKLWEWKDSAPMNIGRIRSIAGAMNGLLYVFGGWTDESDTPSTETEVYDPVSATWKFVSSMPVSMNLHSSIVVDGKFYVVNAVPDVIHNVSWELKGVVYSPREDRWTQMRQELNPNGEIFLLSLMD